MAEPTATPSRERPKKSTECVVADDSDVEVVIESSSKALKTTNTCASLGKVVCCLAIRNRLLHEWYSSRNVPYVLRLNASISWSCLDAQPKLSAGGGEFGPVCWSSAPYSYHFKKAVLGRLFCRRSPLPSLPTTCKTAQHFQREADEMRSVVAAIKEEMAECTAEVEDLRARMAREVADYKPGSVRSSY